jgi:cell division protein FtsW
MFARTDRGTIATWWWTVDKPLMGFIIALMFSGLVLSLAGSPPVAERLGLGSFHFVVRHGFFLVVALGVLIGASLMTPRMVRRSALVVFLASLVLMALTLVIGMEIKGARRWLDMGFFALQPSEFIKPAFAVVAAWLFAQAESRPDMPAKAIAFAAVAMVAGLLILQPDFGQTMLIVLVWAVIFFAAGMPWQWISALAGLGVSGLGAAYALVPHVRGRIDRFINPGSHDTYQTDTAIEAFLRGGWLGRGPGEGTVKQVLPDSHTDFVFAVAAEEFGVLVCLVIAALFAVVVLRALMRAMRTSDPFTRLAVVGLAALFGLQSVINMSVNLSLVPAKGMTLPLISYGGSSLVSMAYTLGMVLALTRRGRGADMSARAAHGYVPQAAAGIRA